MSEQKLPSEIETLRTRVQVGAKSASHTEGVYAADAFSSLGYDNSFDFKSFKKNFKINILESSDDSMMFDMIGIDAPLANAFRRILLAEVPTLAIEKVIIFQNTSIIMDEALSHRLGLIPLAADPRLFKSLKESKDVPNEDNTLVFTLEVKCTRNPDASDVAPPSTKFINSLVKASDLRWVPQGKQGDKFTAEDVGPLHKDITIAKLRPGQTIEAELHASKGIGQEHMKWSPVATAFYRLLPDIVLKEKIEGKLAEELVKKCPMNVFDIEDLGGGKKTVKVARPRNCTMCRECVREPEWAERVRLMRVRDHFIFSIETTGAYSPKNVFKEALKIFAAKCQNVLTEMKKANPKGSKKL